MICADTNEVKITKIKQEKFFFMHKNALEEFESNHHIEELVKNDSDEVMLSLNNEHISEKNLTKLICGLSSYLMIQH